MSSSSFIRSVGMAALVVMVMVSGVVPFAAPVGTAAAAPTIIEDHEDGTRGGWGSSSDGPGTLWTIDSTNPLEGSYSYRMYAAGDNWWTTSQINFPDASPSRISMLFRIDSTGSNSNTLSVYGDSAGPIFSETISSGGSIAGISVGANNPVKLSWENIDYSANTYDFVITDADTGALVGELTGRSFDNNDGGISRIRIRHRDNADYTVDFLEMDGATPPVSVSGVVEDNVGNNLGNAAVTIYDTDGTTVLDTATTDSAGAYSMKVAEGTGYTIEAVKSGYEVGSQSLAVSGPTSGVDFALAPLNPTINGTVKTQDGVPKPRVTVTATDSVGNVAATTQTDGNGEYSFELGAGDYTLVSSAAHYADSQPVSVTTDGTNLTTAPLMTVTRLGEYEGGLYSEMKPNVGGTLEEGEISYHCDTDRATSFVRGISILVNNDDTYGCTVDDTGTTQVDMLSAAASMNQTEQEMFIIATNRLEDARGIAYTEGKVAAIEVLNRGGNQTEAQAAAREAIEDYYAVLWNNILTRWSTSAAQGDYISDAETDAGKAGWIKTIDAATGADASGFGSKTAMTVTLPNGETESFTTYTTSGGDVVSPVPTVSSSSAGNVTDGFGIKVYGPNSTSWSTFGNAGTYGALLGSVETQENQVKGNVATLVTSVYNNYDQDEVDISDYLSPVEIATTASTDYESTGFYSYAAAELASLGYGGNLSHSHTVSIDTANGTVSKDGTVFYTADDITELETGKSYDPSNYAGIFLLASADGVQQLNDPFTIDTTTDVTSGEELSVTELEAIDYGTSDATGFSETLTELSTLRTTIDTMSATAIGGGSDLIGQLGLGGLLDSIGAALGLSREAAFLVVAAAGVTGFIVLTRG